MVVRCDLCMDCGLSEEELWEGVGENDIAMVEQKVQNSLHS